MEMLRGYRYSVVGQMGFYGDMGIREIWWLIRSGEEWLEMLWPLLSVRNTRGQEGVC